MPLPFKLETLRPVPLSPWIATMEILVLAIEESSAESLFLQLLGSQATAVARTPPRISRAIQRHTEQLVNLARLSLWYPSPAGAVLAQFHRSIAKLEKRHSRRYVWYLDGHEPTMVRGWICEALPKYMWHLQGDELSLRADGWSRTREGLEIPLKVQAQSVRRDLEHAQQRAQELQETLTALEQAADLSPAPQPSAQPSVSLFEHLKSSDKGGLDPDSSRVLQSPES
jgi:hypothetical protein